MDDDTHYKDSENMPFIAEQFTRDYVVKVDAHSNSPIFMEDSRQLAFNLLKVGAINKERLIDLVDAPMKQILKQDLKKMEEKQAAMQQAQQAQEAQSGPAEGGQQSWSTQSYW